MKTLILLVIKNLVTMVIRPKFIIWLLQVWAKHTDNKIDDNIVLIVKGGFESQEDLLKRGIEGLSFNLKNNKD